MIIKHLYINSFESTNSSIESVFIELSKLISKIYPLRKSLQLFVTLPVNYETLVTINKALQ